ncbi:hypothetical protein K435DRAFT_807038 [Dendrothele bispora CBS 962.96]|uniref:FAD/NAD(P)-binding domain-containing protein n=1 Tax=Dendrothele bispora (strain CBS 962.96) TaxID=1314807 RepID=A0A4S8L6E1_DENBC|nr:hypothetical protein K435DRAFT_807038 [Dendrothele bispora CBS 962.96]
MNHRSGTAAMLRQFCFDLDEVQEGIGLGFGLGDDSDSMHCEPLPSNRSEMTCLDEVVIRVVELSTASASRHSGSNASMRRWFVSICFYMASGDSMFSCDLDLPNFHSNSDLDLDSHPQCVQLGYSIIMRAVSSIPATSTSSSKQTIGGSNTDFLESSSSQRGPSYYTGSLLPHSLRSAPNSRSLRCLIQDQATMILQQVIIGPQPAIYLAQARISTWSFLKISWVKASPLPSMNLLGPKLMDEFLEQPLRFCTRIITGPISKIDLSRRPFRYWCKGQEDEEIETADTVIVATGASAKEEQTSSCHRDLTKYDSHVYVLVHSNELRASDIMAKRPMNSPKITILWNTVATECQDNSELLKNPRIRNVQTGSEKDLAVNGLFYALGHEPAMAIFCTQLETDPDGGEVDCGGEKEMMGK